MGAKNLENTNPDDLFDSDVDIEIDGAAKRRQPPQAIPLTVSQMEQELPVDKPLSADALQEHSKQPDIVIEHPIVPVKDPHRRAAFILTTLGFACSGMIIGIYAGIEYLI